MVEFPFQRNTHYSLGQLRQFRAQLTRIRQADQDFSSKLRSNVPEINWGKLWNEELAPLAILTDMLKCDGEGKFKISKEALSGPDAYLTFEDVEWRVQITISDPAWGNDGEGGYTKFLQHEVLREGGVAWGGGGTRKDSGKIVSTPKVLNSHERITACRRGIWNALERKASKSEGANLLLVYARNYLIQTIDEGFQSAVEPVIESFFLQRAQFDFERTIFVTDDGGPSFDWHRNGK